MLKFGSFSLKVGTGKLCLQNQRTNDHQNYVNSLTYALAGDGFQTILAT